MIENSQINNSQNKKLPTVLTVRCPHCYKLYSVEVNTIFSSQPEFTCTACLCHFSFDYPPQNRHAIYTKTLLLPQAEQLQKHTKINQSLKLCRKCSALNPKSANECYKCGVIFSKYESVVKENISQARPSLIKLWQDLMQDYENLTKHFSFVDQCEELQALPFALKKYKELKKVQPQDSLADQMLNSVIMKTLSRKAGGIIHNPWLQKIKIVPWENLLRISPIFLGILFILIGLSSSLNRNFSGGGVALLVLYLGLSYVRKGRLSLKDFWY